MTMKWLDDRYKDLLELQVSKWVHKLPEWAAAVAKKVVLLIQLLHCSWMARPMVLHGPGPVP